MIYKLFSTSGIIILFSAYIMLSYNIIPKELFYILNFQASYLLAHSAYGRKLKDFFIMQLIWCLISFINIIQGDLLF